MRGVPDLALPCFFLYRKIMDNAIINSTEKKRGRGRPRKDTVAQHFTMAVFLSELIDEWAARHGITRPEAIRRLIQRGLEAEKKGE